MAFSTVLASRVGNLWHSHTGGESWCLFNVVQVNGTIIFHCHGPKWLLARYWLRGWVSCDTHTPGGNPGVFLICSSQRDYNLSLPWSEMAFSTVLASRVGNLWHSHTGGESWCLFNVVQVNGTIIFHCHGPKWLLARYWLRGWVSCDTHTPGGNPGVFLMLFKSTGL